MARVPCYIGNWCWKTPGGHFAPHLPVPVQAGTGIPANLSSLTFHPLRFFIVSVTSVVVRGPSLCSTSVANPAADLARVGLEAHWQISEGPFKLPKGSLRSGPTVRWASCGSIVINLSGHERTSPPQVRIALSGAWGFLQSGPLRSIRRNPTYGRTYSRIGV